MKYCRNCKQMVQPVKKVNWVVLIVLFLFSLGTLAVLYLIYYVFFKRPVCPMCNDTNWGRPSEKVPQTSVSPETAKSLNKLNRVTKIIEFYNKKGYEILDYKFEDPFLKATISKDNKTYLATINVETNKVEYKSVRI